MKDRPILSRSHKLTDFQKRGLTENVEAVVNVVVKRFAAGDKASDIARTLSGQLDNPRFRFLDQVPNAKQSLLEMVGRRSDAADQIKIVEALERHGIKQSSYD